MLLAGAASILRPCGTCAHTCRICASRTYISLVVFVVVVLMIPALPTQVSLYLPGRLRVIKEQPKLVVADRAKVQLFIIGSILFLIA